MQDFEKLGLFYLGRPYDLGTKQAATVPLLYDSTDLVTHAVCVGMTGSGKTGLCIDLLEEAAIDGVPALAIDPKGDLGNLMLTFPKLRAEDFRPWIDEDEARRNDATPDEWARSQAELWHRGLAAWGQDGDRIQRLREAADVAIYTPGSDAGLPLSILKTFSAPPPGSADNDSLRERVASTAASLLGLIGLDADPLKSREHILLSTLFDDAWTKGQDVDLPALVKLVQTPPFERVGVLDLEAFYPAKDRFQLTMALNNLLAAPGFSLWTEGAPLDVQRLLFTTEGKPRISVLSIAHLNDAERMFFVALLLNAVLAWMRQQSGTTSLRAIIYMDEIAGYLPPVANPASKGPMLTLLKQARAFGVGMVLATQNPIDLDYKALSNAGTWLIGRLQTARDQERLLDGLEGAVGSASSVDRASLQRTIGGLGKRVFLLHNVHEPQPTIFESRWALSYLRGPLTRDQIRDLTRGPEAPGSEREAPASGPEPAREPSTAKQGSAVTERPARWVLPPGVPQYFAPAAAGAHLVPVIAGAAEVRFTDARTRVDVSRSVTMTAPIVDEPIPVDWHDAQPAPFEVSDLSEEPPADATLTDLPAPASKAASYAAWKKSFATWLSSSQVLELRRSPSLGLVSQPGETDGDFRARLQHAARERRDAEVAALRRKHSGRVETLKERLRRAEQRVDREQQQVTDRRMDTAISFGATVLGALFGRKTLSATTVGRATTTARNMQRVSRESADVARAEENASAVQRHIGELDTELRKEIEKIDAASQTATETLETVAIKPKRGGIHVQFVALTWKGEERD
jgi:hypothetical protein